MLVLGISIIFNAIVLFTTALMQAHGDVNRPVVNMFIGGILKLVAVYVLTQNRTIGILGAPIGTLLCYLCITSLNIISIRKRLEHPPAIIRNLSRSFLSAAIMGAFAFGCWFGLKTIGISSRLILCALPVMVGVVVYLIAVVKLKAITREDVIYAAKGVKLHTIYKLLPKEGPIC
jgi:stage V sporulation protein B